VGPVSGEERERSGKSWLPGTGAALDAVSGDRAGLRNPYNFIFAPLPSLMREISHLASQCRFRQDAQRAPPRGTTLAHRAAGVLLGAHTRAIIEGKAVKSCDCSRLLFRSGSGESCPACPTVLLVISR